MADPGGVNLLSAKVRGIYSTALTRLLLDNGFDIVQPSMAIKQRFGLPENTAPSDIKIKDRYNLQGVRALGTANALSAFQSILHSSFEDVITRRWPVSVAGIYKGEIVDEDEYAIYVNIDHGIVGKLPKSEIIDKKARWIVVQVERKRIGGKHPSLTTKLKVIGNYAILIQNSKIGVSLKVHDLNRRAQLYALGRELAPNGWGIIWREASTCQTKGKLENEIAILVEKVKALNKRAPYTEATTLLVEGLYFMDVEFPSISKRKMDELRASTTPTLSGHHFYKSCGGKVSVALEMAEKLLEKGQDKSEVEELFKKQTSSEFPEVGSMVDVEHVKLSGLVLHLGQALIESLDDEQIKYSRTMRRSGFYDGLGIQKEAGDIAVSETKTGEWYIITKYFSKSGELKGTYINLNTPVEVYPKAIRYVDLEVDVCIPPNGNVKVVDMEKLEKALEKGLLSRALFEKVKEKVREAMESNFIKRINFI